MWRLKHLLAILLEDVHCKTHFSFLSEGKKLIVSQGIVPHKLHPSGFLHEIESGILADFYFPRTSPSRFYLHLTGELIVGEASHKVVRKCSLFGYANKRKRKYKKKKNIPNKNVSSVTVNLFYIPSSN